MVKASAEKISVKGSLYREVKIDPELRLQAGSQYSVEGMIAFDRACPPVTGGRAVHPRAKLKKNNVKHSLFEMFFAKNAFRILGSL